MKKIIHFFSFLLFVLLAACGNADSSFENITAKEAKKLFDSNDIVVLDVRTPEEFEQGHIPNATLLPLQELEERLNELNKSETYLLVCRSGNRSGQAGEILTRNGFTNVYNMTGGMNSWSYEIE